MLIPRRQLLPSPTFYWTPTLSLKMVGIILFSISFYDDYILIHFPEAQWRYKKAPDYSLSNKTFEETKSTNWAPSSIELLVQNLVKNWEKEASYKVDPKEWRTISQESYSFHLNGGPGMSAADMLHLGTYNALIGADGVKGVYETSSMDFSSSHKLFKGAMKTFNWEVLEVLGDPPKVSIKWRHWGKPKTSLTQQEYRY